MIEFRASTPNELAESLNGRQYLREITEAEENEMREWDTVAVFGYSDDNIEFRGGISDELGVHGDTTIYLDRYGSFVEDGPFEITARWGAKDENGEQASWVIESSIPHKTFRIYEDDELFCVGIAFSMEDLRENRADGIKECCATCKHNYKLVKFDYSKRGCEHTTLEGYACTAFSNEGVITWMYGNNVDTGMCECYEPKTRLHGIRVM